MVLGALAIGIVLGFVLGGVGPRRELEASSAEVARLERALEEAGPRGGGWRSPVPGFDRILRAPEDEGVPLPPAGEASPEEAPAEERSEGELAQDIDDGDGGVPRSDWRERWADESAERMDAFRRAASIQRVRRMQSRAALVQAAGLDEAESAEVDDALRAMNEELYGHGEELLQLAMGDEPPTARDLLGITHDVTGILHRAQVRIEEVLGPERTAEVDPSALEIWNHVDLAQLEPAARATVDRRR